MANNGHEETQERVKKCPFSGSWCEKDACVLWAVITQNVGGIIRKAGMCTMVATNMILSEINQRMSQQTKQPAQKIILPGMHG